MVNLTLLQIALIVFTWLTRNSTNGLSGLSVDQNLISLKTQCSLKIQLVQLKYIAVVSILKHYINNSYYRIELIFKKSRHNLILYDPATHASPGYTVRYLLVKQKHIFTLNYIFVKILLLMVSR